MRSIQLRTDQIRDAITKTTRMLARDNIRVTQIGAQAYCNFDKKTGKALSINLPVIPDEPTDEFLAALQGFLDHEVAHFYLTNASEYGGTKTITDLSGTERKVDTSGMTNIVEDVRIERGFIKMFPGAEANLEATQRFMIEKYWGKWLGQVDASALDPTEKETRKRTLAMVPFMRARGGQKICAQWLSDNGLFELYKPLDDRIPDLADRLMAMQSTADATELAKLIIEALYPPKPPEKKAGDKGGKGKEPEQKPGKAQDLDDIDFGSAGKMDDTPADEVGDKPEPQGKPEAEKPESGEKDDPGEGAKGEDGGKDPGEGGSEGEGGSGEGTESADKGAGSDEPGEEPGEDGAPTEGDKEAKEPESKGKGQQNIPLKEAMKKLSPEQRRALYLYNKKKQSVAEIASKLGKSPDATRKLLGKARRDLSKAMKGKR